MTDLINELIEDGFRNQPEKHWPIYGRPPDETLDRSKYVTASEIGYCARKIWYSKQLPQRGGLQKYGFAERGHTAEAWVVEQIRNNQQGWNLLYAGDEQVSFVVGVQSGTPDGVLTADQQGYWLFECKCIDPRTSKTLLPRRQHIWQCQQNMELVEVNLNIQLKGTKILYIDSADYEDRIVHEIEFDNDLQTKLDKRARKIMNAKCAEELEPEGMFDGGCKFCDFKAECSAAVGAAKLEREKAEKTKAVSKGVFT